MGLGFLGERAETSDIPAGSPRGRAAERILAAELLEEFRRLTGTMTEFSARYAHGVVNKVLEVATRNIPSAGYVTREYGVVCGCIEIRNLGSADMTIVSSGPGGASAPKVGVGVYIVPAGAVQTINVASRQITIWGASGDTVSYQAFTDWGRGGSAEPSPAESGSGS